MRNENRIAALRQAANERWKDGLFTPTASSWGMFSYGDAPAAIGGGVGSFTWFDTRAAMLKFIEDVFPFSPPGPQSSDPLVVAEKVSSLVAKLRSGDLDMEIAKRKLNLALRSYSQIEWVGTFKDLKDGKSTYAKKLIKQFRQSQDLPISAVPIVIPRSQLTNFKAFLANFGL